MEEVKRGVDIIKDTPERESTSASKGVDMLETGTKDGKTEQTSEKAKNESTLKNILKEGPGLSVLKISATALTAISMALISSRLTGLVNSLILVGMVSVGTAMMSEFYRIILSLTSVGAKKVVLPVMKVNADGTTSKTVINMETTVTDNVADALKDSSSSPTIQENDSSLIDKISENNQKDGEKFVKTSFNPVRSIKGYLERNPQMKTALLFTLMATLTIGVNYYVTTHNQVEPSVQHTVVHTTNKEELSDSEKEEIIDSAVDKAKNTIPASPPTVIISPAPEDNSDDEINNQQTATDEQLQTQIEELRVQNQQLQERLDALEAKDAESTVPVDNLPTPITETSENDEIIVLLQQQIKSLEETIATLQVQVENLRKEVQASTPSEPSGVSSPSQNSIGG